MNSIKIASVLALGAALAADARLYESYDNVADELQAINWQVRAKDELAKLDDAWCADFLAAGAAKADALLAEVKGAYDTDPLVATKISTLTHYAASLDCAPWWKFWADSVPAVRRLWSERLLAAAKSAEDPYVQAFMLQELRWCGTGDQAEAIAAFGRNSGHRVVRDQAQLAVKTLGGDWTPGYPFEVRERFVPLFNGRDLSGWYGSNCYGVDPEEPGVLLYSTNLLKGAEATGRNLLTEKEYSNFVLRFEVKLSENADSGLGLRVPDEKVDAAFDGMCELQILDDGGSKYFDSVGATNRCLPFQYCCSAFGIFPVRKDNVDRQIWGKDRNFAGGGSYARKVGMWNFVEVRVAGGEIECYLNGYLVTKGDVSRFRGDGDTIDGRRHPGLHRKSGHISWCGNDTDVRWKNIRIMELPDDAEMDDLGRACPCQKKFGEMLEDDGFVPYFTGCPSQLEKNWKGVTTDEKFDNPAVRQAATAEKRAEMQKKADAEMARHWTVRNGALHFDGFRGGYSLATKRDYADFEMWADWRIMSVTGDSGLYLRGSPQVQIWDAHNQWHIGSGGLYNNQKNPSRALVIADRQVGDWNRFHVVMKGEKVTVWLNGELVVDNVVLENYWDRSRPIFPCEQIELQCHGDPTEWRNIYIKEL